MTRSKTTSILAPLVGAIAVAMMMGSAPAAATDIDLDDLPDLPIRRILPAPSLPVPPVIVIVVED
jgi:hypothetical protein